jgi:hypothetical protein
VSKRHVIPTMKQSVGHIHLRPRATRHNRPLSEVFLITIPAKTERKVVMNKDTGAYEVRHEIVTEAGQRPMTADEIKDARHSVLRALDSTTKWGKPNTPPATKKKVEAPK